MKPLLAVIMVALIACNEDTVVMVESDTAWRGDIEQYGTVEGRGNAQFDISEGTDKKCWTFQKLTSGGTTYTSCSVTAISGGSHASCGITGVTVLAANQLSIVALQ